MPYIHLIVFGLVAFVPEWRRTGFIIFLAALANIFYAPLTAAASLADNYNVPLVYVAADFLTILALLKWGSKGRFLQASVLTLFMTWNLALLLDYKSPPYPIYDSYSQVIFALNAIQILLISGGIYAVALRGRDMVNGFLGSLRTGVPDYLPDRRGDMEHMERDQ